ncbi:hypothetical protein GGX14DRAFT_657814 [Mycena pura]|uniref:Uncharacterized protein n=1 Tax=Mycena pura TaxID=153505 RepID=A0AAD6YM64_9AGAR|nr:hypothetical protein GGX14DRAFT_657814 [Mycena pura]
MSTASGRQQGSEVLRNMGADECGEDWLLQSRVVHPGGRRSKRECCNTVKFPLGTRPGSKPFGVEEAERAWPQLVRCAVPYAWCPISKDEDKRESISGEEASLRQDVNSSAPSGDPSSGPKPRPEWGPGPWKPSGSGRGAEAKTSVIRECIAKMWQSFGHMTERAGRKQTQGSEDREWLHRARMCLEELSKVSECRRYTGETTRGCGQMWCRSNVAELKSQAGERLGVPRMVIKGSYEVSECRRCTGETARRCGQDLWASRDWVQAQCDRIKAIAKASALRPAWGLVAELKTCTATPVNRPEYRCTGAQGQE